MPVIDSSVLVEYLVEGEKADEAGAVVAGGDLVAPHLIDAEVGSALRRLVAEGVVEAEDARQSLSDLARFPLLRSPHEFLLESAWALRSRLSFYDALYAALAVELDRRLVTADGGLARAAAGIGLEVARL